MSDIIWGFVVGWFFVGFLTFLGEIFFDGEVFTEFIYMDNLPKDIMGIFMFFACVGAWPMVILYEILRPKK